jgi:PKD domain/Cutinase/von Willebrand factor type A domain
MWKSPFRALCTVACVGTLVSLVLAGSSGVTAARASGIGAWNFGNACPNILVIGARGSGQERDAKGNFTPSSPTLGVGPEIFDFYQQLANQLPDLSVGVLANGYPAIPLDQWNDPKLDIFDSVDDGMVGTRILVAAVVKQCGAQTRIVLTGYSQGAWATKKGAGFVLPDDQSHVAAMALFADPSFDPNGGGIFLGGFDATKGGLAGRLPVPSYLKANTLSVCLRHDLVCQSDTAGDLLENLLAFGITIHTQGYLDFILQRVAAGVIAARLRGNAIDLVFAIDTTGSMIPYIAGVKAAAASLTGSLLGSSGTNARVAVVDYKDLYSGCPSDGYAARTDIGFSTNQAAVQAAINSLTATGGCDRPESVYSGLIQALRLPWRHGVKKVIVLMGDAPPHDPEPTTGYTLASVLAAAKVVDPAVIDAINIGGGGDPYFDSLASGSGGENEIVGNPADAVSAILDTINQITQAPIANAGGPYTGAVGVPLTFDASASFSPTGSLTTYEWDFDGDGVYDATTNVPRVSHTYPAPFTGEIAVRVTDDESPPQSSIATAPVTVVVDTTPPVLACNVQPAVLWPPNHQLVQVLAGVLVTDTEAGPGDFKLTSVKSSEPDQGLGDGDTPGDIQGFEVGTDSVSGQLRAERAGTGPGRVYTLTYQGSDLAGNTANCEVKVTVPHGK